MVVSPFMVYLRARGGTSSRRLFLLRALGLSPRTRRNPRSRMPLRSKNRSISAHAEEPASHSARWLAWRVYLRARGGTRVVENMLEPSQGLSPRTRRNRPSDVFFARPRGSISAHAEEPRAARTAIATRGVYLRARGGTRLASLRYPSAKGLSPRTRRNPREARCLLMCLGPISAHAEEPMRSPEKM
ncbi:Hypothetical protein GbCGDNIH9_1629 [Granulibacter bethesdensis]|uniref:Uncharacterized protein n=1 Tax=Granulibacter bethesdensis TaxID=364410 RepID=A0AAC9KAR1_9PROT|nr:Hypothetical protein GbCGDNIH9_1629 [Granulibacter bethesdensis]APH62513.1 Hypothetical protein GbCGDNIH8_7112b [Granulibacter bethesdensis]